MPATDLLRLTASLSTTVHAGDLAGGMVSIDLLSVPAELRGRGCAQQALDLITGWADNTGTPLRLTATAALGANLHRLVTLYTRHGFVVRGWADRSDVLMHRAPADRS